MKKLITSTLAMALLTTATSAAAAAEEQAVETATAPITGSRSFQFSENNDHVIAQQIQAGDPAAVGDVKIEFYGHMAFKITSPAGVTLVIDPWRNDPTGTFGIWYDGEFPEIAADIALSSHAHFDHDALYRVHAAMNLERMAGEFKLGDVRISGLADKHQCIAPGEVNWTAYLKQEFGLDLAKLCPDDSPMSWDNVIYKIETGGMKIGFWGDNRPDPAPEVMAQLKDLDVLIMNIDGSNHILSYAQIEAILAELKPKAIIPGHYQQIGTVLDSATLKSADQWVDAREDKVKLAAAEMTLNAKLLENADGRVYYFGNHVKKD